MANENEKLKLVDGKPKIGVYVCHCGGNISDVVDVESVAGRLAEEDDVLVSVTNMFMCSTAGQQLIEDDLNSGKVNRVVVASCSPKLHQSTFRGACVRGGLNPYLYEHANIREQVSWVHSHNKKEATDKAIRLTRSAIQKVREQEALETIKVPNTKRTVVIGGGVAGMRSALDIATSGIHVELVERSPFLGGRMAQLGKLFPTEEDARDKIQELVERVRSNPRVTIHLNTKLLSVTGFVGNFEVTVEEIQSRGIVGNPTNDEVAKAVAVCPEVIPHETDPSGRGPLKAFRLPYRGSDPHSPSIDWNHCSRCGECQKVTYAQAQVELDPPVRTQVIKAGALVVATGFNPYQPYEDEYGYNTHTNVITHLDLLQMMGEDGPFAKEFMWEGKPIRSVGFIHCVGSRQADGIHETPDGHLNEYCSRVCCNATLQLANELKERFPQVEIYDFYQDIRTYARYTEQNYYEKASKNGVIFLKYLPEELPTVAKPNEDLNTLHVTVNDQLTFGEELTVPVDLLVLSVGMVPRPQETLVSDIKLAVGNDGFLLEVHPKLRPVEMAVNGVMLAGTAQSPMDVTEASAGASAAASKASILLGRDFTELDPYVARVNPAFCDSTQCNQECLEVCGKEGAISIVENQALVNPALCVGGGNCVAVCPRDNAIDIVGYSIASIDKMVDAFV